MKNYIKENRVLSIATTVSCFIVIASFFLSDWQWLTSVNYPLHEMLMFPVLVGYFLIPIEMIAGFIIYVKYKKKSGKSIINMLLNTSAIFSLLACLAAISFFTGRSVSSGFEANIKKYEMNDCYYVELNKRPIEISESQYSLIIDNEPYMYSYEYTKWIGKDYYRINYLKNE